MKNSSCDAIRLVFLVLGHFPSLPLRLSVSRMVQDAAHGTASRGQKAVLFGAQYH